MLAVRCVIYCGCPSVVSSIFPASNGHTAVFGTFHPAVLSVV